jgi:hypothetical protein
VLAMVCQSEVRGASVIKPSSNLHSFEIVLARKVGQYLSSCIEY